MRILVSNDDGYHTPGIHALANDGAHLSDDTVSSTVAAAMEGFIFGLSGAAKDAERGTDFHAISEGKISKTPLNINLTHTELLLEVRNWWEIR